MTDTSDHTATPADPGSRSVVVAVVLLDATPDWERVSDVLAPGNLESPLFRHRLVDVPFGLDPPRWTRHPDTDPPWHLERLSLPAPATFDDVLEFARVAPTVPDLRHPRWDLTLFDGLTGGQSALMIRLHHLGPEEGTDRESGWSWARAVSEQGTDMVRSATQIVTRTAVAFVRAVLGEPTPPQAMGPDDGNRPGRLHVVDVPVAELRGAAERAGCALDSAFVAAMLLACATYRRRRRQPIDDLCAAVAGPDRPPVRIYLQDDDGTPIELMRRIESSRDAGEITELFRDPRVRAEPVSALSDTEELFGPGDVFVSALPGSSAPLYIGGARIERYYGFGPTRGAAFHATLMTYRTGCCIGVTVDAGTVPDRELFDECLSAGLQAVVGAADDDVRPVDLPGQSG